MSVYVDLLNLKDDKPKKERRILSQRKSKASYIHSTQRKTNTQSPRKAHYSMPPQISCKYKTRLCSSWQSGQLCPFQHMCTFAHGFHELRNTFYSNPKYKTKPCNSFKINGYCQAGDRCPFIHRKTLSMDISVLTSLLSRRSQSMTQKLHEELPHCFLIEDDFNPIFRSRLPVFLRSTYSQRILNAMLNF